MDGNSSNILGVRIDNLSKREILEKIEAYLDEEKFHQIATINPEFILEARKNTEYEEILNNCSLNVADGIGIWFAFLRFGKYLNCRLTGADLMGVILKKAEKMGIGVYIAVNEDGLSSLDEIKKSISKIYPALIIDGADIKISREYPISNIQYPILFCNFGAPHQELFINSQKNDRIRLAMGVGGSFDYLTGKITRSPRFLQKLGFEWFWRLLVQPNRWKRIFRAVIVFPIRIMINK